MFQNSPIIVPETFRKRFTLAYKNSRILLFHAPCGSGKTSLAMELLKPYHPVCLDAADADFAPESIEESDRVLLLDNLEAMDQEQHQEALCEILRTQKQRHFVLLTRSAVPGWLMPFQFAGLMESFTMQDMLLDKNSIAALTSAYRISLTGAELGAMLCDTQGYPVSVAILMHLIAENGCYNETVLNAGRQQLYLYFDEMVYRRFGPDLRRLLIDVAPFETFNVEMARLLSGDNRAGELIAQIQKDTSMLQPGSPEMLQIRPIFRSFLLWKLSQELSAEEQKKLFSRAGLYYELHEEMKPALDCYAHIGDHAKISQLLVKNAERHVGIGQYLEMEQYYFAMPEAEIRRSPTLMSGMSMLCSLFMDYDQSEGWYRALQDYAGSLSKSDSCYKDAESRLAYLDIALPQRGSNGLIDLITNVFRVMSDRHLKLPAFSVTSTLPSVINGGKDFSEWTKHDTMLYATMRKPVESILGRDGIGLADCALCESFFEKDADYQPKLLTLLSRLSEIQRKGSPDVEFAVIGLLTRVQLAEGHPENAQTTLETLRSRFVEMGETRFLPNMNALLCRIHLQCGDSVSVDRWLREDAPKDDLRMWALYRYQYFTKAMVEIKDGNEERAVRILTRLVSYTEKCGRTFDRLNIHVLCAIAYFRTENALWQAEIEQALTLGCSYHFIRPFSEYGAAILPLLTECRWKQDSDYLEAVIAAARKQAIYYPLFLKQEVLLEEPLTAAEQQVLRLVCHNMSNQEICDILGIKLATVKTHVSRILQKLGVSRRSEAKEAAENLGFV